MGLRRAKPGFDPDILVPPEGVPLRLETAGFGVRLGAQIADILLTSIFTVCIMLVLAKTNLISGKGLFALTALLFFFIRIPYYALTEIAWNGQTLGKRMLRIKVVALGGGSLSAHALVVRNLLKEAEVFLPATLLLGLSGEDGISGWLSFLWIVMALSVPLLDHRKRRLGDIAAGTYVVHLPRPQLLTDVAIAPRSEISSRQNSDRFVFLPHHLEHYGVFELQTLEDILRAQDQRSSQATYDTAQVIASKIRKKIGYGDAVPAGATRAFLEAFYSAQRAHLEQRQLFGDRRADKHHAARPEPRSEKEPR